MSESQEMTIEQRLEQSQRLLFAACRVLRNTDQLTAIKRELVAIGVLEQCQRLYPRDYGQRVADSY